jgi:hypothetical protein
MTTITAEVIAKSSGKRDKTVSTVRCRYPRWIHAEGRTHRLISEGEDEFEGLDMRTPSPMQDPNLSRNAASSRAIPVKRLIEDVRRDPAIPMFWGANQKGMQAGAECTTLIKLKVPHADQTNGGEWLVFWEEIEVTREAAWISAMERAIETAEAFDAAGYHKQIINRLLEPFSHINVLYTATEWDNFYALRIHSAAEPHICLLATKIKDAIDNFPAVDLQPGEWHLPYVTDDEKRNWQSTHEPAEARNVDHSKGAGNALVLEQLIKLSVARCAHLSYETVGDGRAIDWTTAERIYSTLIESTPMHASPAEHQCSPDDTYHSGALGYDLWLRPEDHGNLVGFRQYRRTLRGESVRPTPRMWHTIENFR